MAYVKSPLTLISSTLWIGFVSAISFMEAHLKFLAPGITLALGVGIGRIVFAALNKVEWVLAITVLLSSSFQKEPLFSCKNIGFLLALGILILQTAWLLPALDARAELHITGPAPASSFHHIYYVAAELIKVLCLSLFGIGQIQRVRG
jgi:hypothetical protein